MKTLKEFGLWLESQTANQRQPFSLEALAKIQSLVEIKEYLRTTLGRMADDGQSRLVWNLDQDRVIKVLRSRDNIEENYNEVKNSECIGSRYAVQVFEHHPQFLWLIEERLLIPKSGILEHLRTLLDVNIPSESIDVLIDIGVSKESNRPFHSNKNLMSIHQQLYGHHEWYTGLINVLRDCNVKSEDFHEDNWGIRPGTGEIVLLDLGF